MRSECVGWGARIVGYCINTQLILHIYKLEISSKRSFIGK